MSSEVTRLQELLARVQRNAALPRILAPRGPVTAFANPTAVKSAPVQLDASVDELLLEDPFPSVPPPAPSSYDELLEAPLPPPAAASRVRESDVSGVMAVSELAEQPPEELLEDDIVEVTGGTEAAEAVAPAASRALDELNFDDEELDADQSAPIEEPPASSSRSKVAESMDEALARAAALIDVEDGREVPLKTPPPESGPQEAAILPQGMHAPLSPDIEALLESDVPPRTGVHAALPTAEQLGQTVDLDEARGPSLELDHPRTLSEPVPLHGDPSSQELEVALPQREFAGGYHEDLLPPPEARQELEAHRHRYGDKPSAAPPESLTQSPHSAADASSSAFAPAPAPSAVTTESSSEGVSMVTVDAPPHAEFAPELLARPETSPGPVAKFLRAQSPRPNTFLELLDSSLALGRD